MIAFVIRIRINVSHVCCKLLTLNSKRFRIKYMDLACNKISLSCLNRFFRSCCNILAEVVYYNRAGLKSSDVVGGNSLTLCCLCYRIGKVGCPVDLAV